MATLVLSTVGTALGGPIGGAIGSLVGQAIDQQIFGPGPREGPRLGDLSVQTSTYGTPIPRIYGTMRVAGSVIWATELKESSEVQSGGKGQPDRITYSYSASFAVALSSRPAQQVGRIWADGKLLRGSAGDFKVRTGFRFYTGGEDQLIDPMIASLEGVAGTPAYRGLALAVFEDLDLAEFGNRIPFLTFEVEADFGAPALSAILADASAGAIDCAASAQLDGYAAHGATIRSAVQPLVEHFGIALCDDGSALRSPADETPLELTEQDLGCGVGQESAARIERTLRPARKLPASLSLSYYDPARDYQTGRMRASVSGSGPHEAVELPAVMQADFAKALAQSSLARRWAERDLLTLRLPPSFLHVLPGSQIRAPDGLGLWMAERVTIDSMVVVTQLHPLGSDVPAMAAEPGRQLPPPDVIAEPTVLALLDLPDFGLARHDVPVVHIGACTTSGAWRPVPLEIKVGSEIRAGQSAFGETAIGIATTLLADGQSALFDLANAIDVQLADPDHWLESRDDDALAQGANLAAVGSELVQFGFATALEPGLFRLTRLLRGRRGTEWAMAGHAPNEPFVLVNSTGLGVIELPPAALGSSVEVTALAIGDGAGTTISALASGEAMRPPSPVHLRAELVPGSLELTWVRRSRSGWAWLDEIDAPLGESTEAYRVRLEGGAGTIEIETASPSASFDSAQLAALGSGTILAEVSQVGTYALSRPARLSVVLQ